MMTEQTEKAFREDSESGSTSVHDQDQPAIELKDGPLFVLSYKADRVIFRALMFSFMGLIFGRMSISLLPNPASGFIGLIFAFFFFLCSFCSIAAFVMACDLLLFKEIRLYSGRIVKAWKGLGELEIQLNDAKYGVGPGFSRSGDMHRIYDKNKNRFSLTNQLFVYTNDGADEADIRKLHSVMSELTGQNIEDLRRDFWGWSKWRMKNKDT